ncbi:MAG: endonuclease [Candidatus Symbiothrix sp.]|jgi:predicted extracellular nuclease|nr:endonuclease [Candidatus Symbiothrix sp.]
MNPKYLFLLLFFATSLNVSAQKTFRVMFYNVENLFDTLDEEHKSDNEFLPDGARRWNNSKYYSKLNNLAKVITSVGEWDTPALIGLCEVENDRTMQDLTKHSLLKQMKYQYLITESPDVRGIDVALLYQRDRFKYLYHNEIVVTFPERPRSKTRNILHATGIVSTGDTLDVFVCHFPSRRGGQTQSEPNRLRVASLLRAATDSLHAVRKHAHILVMGDFNDEPSDKSMQSLTRLRTNKAGEPLHLHNLWLPLERTSKIGSYKFGKQWNFLDQMFVSDKLMNQTHPLHVKPQSATIFQADFLFTEDKTHGGVRPKKTFHGRKYEAGYSDHLPIFVDLELKITKK